MYSKSYAKDFDAVMGVEFTKSTVVETSVVEKSRVVEITVELGFEQRGDFSTPTIAHKIRCLCKLTNGRQIKIIKNKLAIFVLNLGVT
jgi:predicted component of type VI protein secretion system